MKKVRYAVVGLGHIAQQAVLPAFRHARADSELAALVSGDPAKLKTLGERYGVGIRADYDGYDRLLRGGAVDAVFIALPNDLHASFAIRAAKAGVHVLCEKPMAPTEKECRAMIAAARAASVRLMVAYRLHFDPANLEAIRDIRSGKLGEPRVFSSTFTMQVRDGNIRAQARRGGGPLLDIGVYCLNAARYLFGDEPLEVAALAENNGEKRFREIDEAVGVTLRFPRARLASFVVSFGASDVGHYRVVGTKGSLELDPAFEYAGGLTRYSAFGERAETRRYAKHDQFAAQLTYFSQCVLKGRDPEPSGEEGLADVRIVQAIERSLRSGKAVRLERAKAGRRPTPAQKIVRPPVRKRDSYRAPSPHPD